MGRWTLAVTPQVPGWYPPAGESEASGAVPARRRVGGAAAAGWHVINTRWGAPPMVALNYGNGRAHLWDATDATASHERVCYPLSNRRELMEKRLSQQIQDVIDLLLSAADHAQDIQQTLSAELTSLGLTFTQVDDDLAQLLNYLLHVKALAEAHEDDVAANHGSNGSHSV